MKKASAILVADIHLREDQPEAWTESYWDAQAETIQILSHLQLEHGCPVLAAGDIFDYWKPSPFLIGWAIDNLPGNFIAVAGQHDLPQHNADLYGKSGLSVLEKAGSIKVLGQGGSAVLVDSRPLHGFPFGAPLAPSEEAGAVALVHAMTYKRKPPFPGCIAPPSSEIIELLRGHDLIVTGDNHNSFTVEIGGVIHVNPGSMMQMTAAQIDHKPVAFLWYSRERRVEPFYLPNHSETISREHLERSAEKDKRLEAFVKRLERDNSGDEALDFTGNLTRFMERSKTRKAVQDLVWTMVDDQER